MRLGQVWGEPVVVPFGTMYLHDDHPPSRSRRVFGELVRKARQARGLSQERLGEWAGLHQSVISRIETGQPIGLRFRTMLRLVDALGITALEPVYAPWHSWAEGASDDDHP